LVDFIIDYILPHATQIFFTSCLVCSRRRAHVIILKLKWQFTNTHSNKRG